MKIKSSLFRFLKRMDRQTLFVSAVTALAAGYYINPLANVDLTEWDRAVSPAVISGISISKRISHFYLLFFVCMPLLYMLVSGLYGWLFQYRDKYKEYYQKISIMLIFPVLVSYLNRFGTEETEVSENGMIQMVLAFLVILAVIALLDAEQIFSFSDAVCFFAGYMAAVPSANILLRAEMGVSMSVAGALFICYAVFICRMPFGRKWFWPGRNLIYLLMWTPAVVRLSLEGIYFFTEKGWGIGRYYTHICKAVLLFVMLSAAAAVFFAQKKKDLSCAGYIGIITSLGFLSQFSYSYQYQWDFYQQYSILYEMGNASVAADTVLHGKLPVIDYFSAHALGDVWTRILYCLIHQDVKGIFVNPYGGLSTIFGFFCLFYLVKALIGKDMAVLFVCLFPLKYYGLKVMSMCGISVVMLLYIIKKPGTRSYLLFWLSLLASAFITYDEGMYLGIGCILAYFLFLLFLKEWKKMRRFLAAGAVTGGTAAGLYMAYAWLTGISAVSRILEWMSVSISSSSVWATADFGDVSAMAFLVSYFLVPMTAAFLLVLTAAGFIKSKKYPAIAITAMAFAFTEIFYIARGIIYHNLAVCLGRTGVLLNFVHWTVSLYVLYVLVLKGCPSSKKVFAWAGTFGLVAVLEGALVTDVFPDTGSMLYVSAVNASESWDLRNNMTENYGKERIVFDQDTTDFINQFQTVFDELLEEDETFLDFANITSLYALTGRDRPCYVGQSPSLLTGLYSQECFLKEIAGYSCPLAILGTTDANYIHQMTGVLHNVRYYKIAEHIYRNYRPLVKTGDFVIWCEKDSHKEFKKKLKAAGCYRRGYEPADYGYDETEEYEDEDGNVRYTYQPVHFYNLGMIPYEWANYDDLQASGNKVLADMKCVDDECYMFAGSREVLDENGNYLAFTCTNPGTEDIRVDVVFQDSGAAGAAYRYGFTVLPGKSTYLIRASQDYFWHAFHIDTVRFDSENEFYVSSVRILEGD